jgi:hypothetical protein
MIKSIFRRIAITNAGLLLFTGITFAQGFSKKENDKVLLGENKLQNASFEAGKEHWQIGRNAVVSTAEGYNSKASLHLTHTDAKMSLPASVQKIKVDPGETVYFSVWVKGKGVDASGSDKNTNGARIYIQSIDENGKFINGMYPASSGAGTYNWKQIGGVYTVPLNATSVSIGIGMIKGVVGEVWFDEVSAKVEGAPLYEAFLLSPNYRGMQLKDDLSPWLVKLRIRPSPSVKPTHKGSVQVTLKNVVKKVLHKKQYKLNLVEKDTVLSFLPEKKLPVGDYTFQIQYFDEKDKLALSQEHAIEIVDQMPKVYIDKNGYTIKNGKKIFPFGVYIGEPSAEHLTRIKEAGFNTVLSYGYGHNKNAETYLDDAEKHGLNVIYSLKDFYEGRSQAVKVTEPRAVALDYIERLKHKPALLSWYTADELLPDWLPKIDVMYNDIKKHDPHHPAFQVHYFEGARMMEKYFYSTDIMAADPYPVGRQDLSLTKIRTDAAVKGMHGVRGVWSVPQLMDWAVYQKDRAPKPPNADEMRNQSYQSLISGAKGLLYYTYYDLFQVKFPRKRELDYTNFNERWKDVLVMSKEIEALTPVILEGKDYFLKVDDKSAVQAKAITFKDEMYIMLANPFYEVKTLSIQKPAGWNVENLQQGQVKAIVQGDRIEFTVSSIGSGIFKLKKSK